MRPKLINMRLDFLKKTTSSQFVLPIVSIFTVLVWVLLPFAHQCSTDQMVHGLWRFLPVEMLQTSIDRYVSVSLAALGVYLLAELNNANMLLRVTSRMLSSTLAFLFALSFCLHSVQPGLVVMLFSLLSFFSLFATYRVSVPIYTFVTFATISVGSLFFPKLLFVIPVYWICQAYLRSLSLRCFFASLFGTLIPYWVLLGVLVNFDGGIVLFVDICTQVIAYSMPDYSTLYITDYMILGYVFILFFFGVVNFYQNSYYDKTRVRTLYNVVIIHGLAMLLYILLQPQHFHTVLPLFLVDASILGGHHLTLTYNRFTHVYSLIMLVLALALIGAQIIL